MPHTCHAIACAAEVAPEMFMCRRHWFRLPKYMRDEIWATYRDGQCDDWAISKDYARAAQRAIRYVARGEGRIVSSIEPELVLYDKLLELGGTHGKSIT